RVGEGSLAGFGEATLRPLAGLRAIAGLRADHYWYAVRARDAAAVALGEGAGAASLVSPKLALAYAATPALEFYANWGRGFHSNDVRGAV
ncbi:TonB-dependent receptor, partial [Acinetobacter baumannii]